MEPVYTKPAQKGHEIQIAVLIGLAQARGAAVARPCDRRVNAFPETQIGLLTVLSYTSPPCHRRVAAVPPPRVTAAVSPPSPIGAG